MPVQVTYPGVYIEEIPSGQHVITGVATSITAFIGRAPVGPIDEPITIFNFGDYQRMFGGLSYNYPMSYAVQGFFLNGGSQAVIVRLFQPKTAPKASTGGPKSDAPKESIDGIARFFTNNFLGQAGNISYNSTIPQGTVNLKNMDPSLSPKAGDTILIGSCPDYLKVSQYNTSPNSVITFAPVVSSKILIDITAQRSQNIYGVPKSPNLLLKAANPGKWGNGLVAAIDYKGIIASIGKDSKPIYNNQVVQLYSQYGLTGADLFNLTVAYYKPDGTQMVERFTNVTNPSTVPSPPPPNLLKNVLKEKSQLVRVSDSGTPGLGYDSDYLDVPTYNGDEGKKTGIYMLEKIDLFNILCIPPDNRTPGGDNTDSSVYTEALVFCVAKRAMLIVDPPTNWTDSFNQGEITAIQPTDPNLGVNGPDARNAAVYFPRVRMKDPEINEKVETFPACGIIAGCWAATDFARGVWKAPAGIDVALMGIEELEVKLNDSENGILNPLGINCLRNFPVIGPVVWGARTLRGADQLESDYKYIPVRRLTLFIEDSLFRGTQWAVFEPNDEALWSSLRLSVGTFLAGLQRQGAFYNYQVVCDNTTTTPDDIALGIVNILVMIAPVKPAEFVVIKIQQIAAKT